MVWTSEPLSLWLGRNRQQLGLAARMVVASLVTYSLCHAFDLPQSQWAVLTAVVVMQGSVGASLKATMDRFIGSLGGAVWGVCILLVVPHGDRFALGVALVFAMLPLSILAAYRPAYRVAPITAVILLLIPHPQINGPLQTAIQRMLEVGIGSAVAMVVALCVFPARAHHALTDAAAEALTLLADLMEMLVRDQAGPTDASAFARVHQEIRKAITRAEIIAEEAKRERRTYLINAPDPLPICRTLRRLRIDVTMLGRALDGPLPHSPDATLRNSSKETVLAISIYMRANALAIAAHRPPPGREVVEAALSSSAATLASMRRKGATRELPDDEVRRIFGLAFGLEQMGRNLEDLAGRTQEFATEQPR